MSQSIRFTFIAIVVCAAMGGAQELTVTAVQDDVLVVSGGGGNVTAVRTAEGVVVIDSFVSPAAGAGARALIEKQFPGAPIRYLINTHHHWDHTFGNQIFRDALIIAHINNSDRVGRDYAERAAEYAGSAGKIADLERHLAEHAGADPAKIEELKKELERWQGIRRNYGDFALTPAPFSLESGARLEFGGKTFHLLHFGKGHTDGDIVILIPEDRLLVTGDLLFHHTIPYIDVPAGADIDNWAATLGRLIGRAAEFDTVVPGHGLVGTADALRDMRAYLLDLRAAVQQAKAAGTSLEQAKTEITLDQYKGYARYNALPANIEAAWRIVAKP